MKILPLLGCVLLFGSCASSNRFVKDQSRYDAIHTVAIMRFSCQPRGVGEAISGGVASKLLESKWTVISRLQFDKMLRDQGIVIDSTNDYSVAIGKVQGIDAIISGSASTSSIQDARLTIAGDLVTGASAQLIDLSTGTIIAAATFSHSINSYGYRESPTEIGETLAKQLMP